MFYEHDNQIAEQLNREKMAEARRYKKRAESLESKIKRCSENEKLVKKTELEIENVNACIDEIMKSLSYLCKNESAWALKYSNTKALCEAKINLPKQVCNNLLGLIKTQASFKSKLSFDELRMLDFIRLIGDDDVINTALRVIEEEGGSFDLNTLIVTIKRIHIDRLKNLRIPIKTLVKFCDNRYVKVTRPKTVLAAAFRDVHEQFEVELAPALANKSDRGWGINVARHPDFAAKPKSTSRRSKKSLERRRVRKRASQE